MELYSPEWRAHLERGRIGAVVAAANQTSGPDAAQNARDQFLAALAAGPPANQTDRLRWWTWLARWDAGERPEPPQECGAPAIASAARLMLETDAPSPAPAATEPPAYLGDERIRMPGGPPIVLTDAADTVLRALIELGGAATKEALVKASGEPNAPRILRALTARHPDLAAHIVLPGRRGAGGYRTTIRDARANRPVTKAHL